jgi:hypothetical protein
MVRTFLKVYMELGSYFLFLQEQIKDIIIIMCPSAFPCALTSCSSSRMHALCAAVTTSFCPRHPGCLSARAVVTQEVIGLMRQSAELEDDLKRVGKYELRRSMRCLSITHPGA